MRKPLTMTIAVTALVALSATGASLLTTSAAAAGTRLHAFASCGELLGYAKRHAGRAVGPWGLGGIGIAPGTPMAATAEAAAGTARDAAPGVDYSTTNVQEAGVDEPDIVKTDGSTIFAIAQGKLYAVDTRGATPRLVGSLSLSGGWNQQLFLSGNRALVIMGSGGGVVPLTDAPAEKSFAPEMLPGTQLLEIDISDPAAMRIVRTLSVEGNYVSARLTGSTARVVFASAPVGLGFVAPADGDQQATNEALQRNRGVIARSRLSNWVPHYTLENRRTGRKATRALAGCKQIRRPVEFGGLGMLTVLTIDLSKGLEPVDRDAVMTGGETVYASPQSLYVATQRWVDPQAYETSLPQGVTTALHKFDISDPGQTVYRGSGQVSGYLLGQWALSEYRGKLRVASTDVPGWFTGDTRTESESFVSVLDERDGKLAQIGRVGNLGRGERIYAVRFIDDVGYVVTFRQVDPLYTVDLRDPANPRVIGELKIPGYSAYLHPLGDDLILGVGQDATDEGRVLGTQLSVFDVSNLARPERLQHKTIGQGWSEAEYDHHAFLYWPKTRLAVLPVQAAFVDDAGTQQGFSGAVGYRIDREGIRQVGTVVHLGDVQPRADVVSYPWGAQIRRSVVVGDTLYTISEQGLKSSNLATLTDRGWVAFT
jgi:hypothetical protein